MSNKNNPMQMHRVIANFVTIELITFYSFLNQQERF